MTHLGNVVLMNHFSLRVIYRRKSISGNWKTNLGSAMLEQTPMTDKYRGWIESVSTQFGGLDLCALEVLVARDGREIIMELNDCALPLLGDSQEEDRRLISELVLHRMNVSHVLPFFFFSLPRGAGGKFPYGANRILLIFLYFYFCFFFALLLTLFLCNLFFFLNENRCITFIE
jgi:hypothetical protein